MYAVSSGFLRLMRSAGPIATTESLRGVGILPALFVAGFIALVTPPLHAQFKASLRGTLLGEPGIPGMGSLLPNSVA